MKKNKFKLSELLTQFSKKAAEEGGELYAQAADTVAQNAGAAVPAPVAVAAPEAEIEDDTVGNKAVEALKEIAMEASALEQTAIQKEASEFGKIFAQSFMDEVGGMNKMATEDVLMQAMNESYQATMAFIKAAEDAEDAEDVEEDDKDDDEEEDES